MHLIVGLAIKGGSNLMQCHKDFNALLLFCLCEEFQSPNEFLVEIIVHYEQTRISCAVP